MLNLLLFAPAALAGPHTVLLAVDDPSHVPVEDLGGRLRRCFPAAGLCTVDFDGEPPLAQLRGRFRRVERDALMTLVPTTEPYTDPMGTTACPDLWGTVQIGLGDAWNAAGGRGVGAPFVTVMDSGFLTTHLDLAGRVDRTWDYGDDDDTAEVNWASSVPHHGTFIAGIIAAVDGNVDGRAGVIPEGKLVLHKIADSSGALYFSYAVEAMAALAEDPGAVRVVSYSLASSTDNDAFRDAVEALGEAGVLVVASAGNCSSPGCSDADNDRYPLYPASYDFDHVVSVANSTRDDVLSPYSHHGVESVDLAAPGTDICSLSVEDRTSTTTGSGTSYASPFVAGVAALVWQAWPELTVAEVAAVLRASVDPVGSLEGKVRSGGRLSAVRAVSTAVPRLSTDPEVDREPTGGDAVVVRWENAGAMGEGVIVLTGEDVRFTSAGSWEVDAFSAGDRITLPEGGSWTATVDGALVRGEMAAASMGEVEVWFDAPYDSVIEATVRIVAGSEGGTLGAPVDGDLDPTGQPALAVQIIPPPSDVDTGDSGEPATDGGSGDGGSGDGGSGEGGTADGGTADDDDDESGGGKGGCATAPLGAGLWLALLAAWPRRRRSPTRR